MKNLGALGTLGCIGVFFVLIFTATAQSPTTTSTTFLIPPPPDVLTSQGAAGASLVAYKTWVEKSFATHDAAIVALQAQAPVPGPQGPQGIPGNPSNAIGILVYPSMLVYNPQATSTTSPPQFVMVSNQTATPLPLTAPAIAGPFQLGGGGNCGSLTSLPAGQNCVYGIQFKTGSIGAKVGSLTINVGGLQLSVNLEGMGQ